MRLLDESVVEPHEIDSLGHLNVRHYMDRIARANDALLASFGLTPQALDTVGGALARADMYHRYQREQRLGARLKVLSGLVAAAPQTLRVFHEVRNVDTDDIASVMLTEY